LLLISVTDAEFTAAAFKVTDEPRQMVVSLLVMLAMQELELYNWVISD
jgi:hypothetical protein